VGWLVPGLLVDGLGMGMVLAPLAVTVLARVHAAARRPGRRGAVHRAAGRLPQPGCLGATRLGGIDINRPRAGAALALATCPAGFTAAGFTAKVQAITGDGGCTARQRACGIRKLRAKNLTTRQGRSRRYTTPPDAARAIAAIVILRDQVLIPCLAGVRAAALAPLPVNPATAGQHYQKLRSQRRGATARLRPHGRITATNLSIMFW
jgi:hypothetical protein